MRRALVFLGVGVGIASYLLCASAAWENRAVARQETRAYFVLPSQFTRILSMGYKGLLSDFQFLKLTTLVGERIVHQKRLEEEDWRYFKASVESITDLDPYFLDPYFLAEGLLTWEAGQYEEANRLLEKGVQYRTWDWRLPYFIGFNDFYFLHEYEKGADYLMQASRLPGAPSYLPNLAARLAYYGGKTKTGILFLKGMLASTTDQNLRKIFQMRLLALERAEMIEDAVQKFKMDHGRLPKSHELVAMGYLKEMPADPYGGKWGILENGRVFSSSKFASEKPSAEGR